MSYCFAFFDLFPSVYVCFLVFSCKVFSLYREIFHGTITSLPENTQVFSTWTGRRSEYMYSHLTDGSQELYPSMLPGSHTVTHSDKVYSLSDLASDSRSLQVLLSVTLGYGSALAVYPAESIMKHLHALLSLVAPLRCVTGIHSPSLIFQVPANFYWLDFLLGTFQSNSGLRNNKIFILMSLYIKCMEAVNKVESLLHNSHTTQYPPYPQCSWNSDFLSWDKQLASSDIFFSLSLSAFSLMYSSYNSSLQTSFCKVIFGLLFNLLLLRCKTKPLMPSENSFHKYEIGSCVQRDDSYLRTSFLTTFYNDLFICRVL